MGKSRSKKTRLTVLIVTFGFVAVLIGSAVAASLFASPSSPVGPKFGGLGSDHKHSAFMIIIDRRPIDFSQDKYQVRSAYMHVEDNDGTTLHRHGLFVPFREFITSVNMDIVDGCFVMDNVTKYCEGASGKTLKFYVNTVEQPAIMDYIPRDNDRILIHYGENDINQIRTELNTLNGIPIARQ